MSNLHPQSLRNIEHAAQFQVRRLPDGHYYIAACRLCNSTLSHVFKSQTKHPEATQWTDEDLWNPIAYTTGELVTFSEPATARAWINRQSHIADNPAPIAPNH